MDQTNAPAKDGPDEPVCTLSMASGFISGPLQSLSAFHRFLLERSRGLAPQRSHCGNLAATRGAARERFSGSCGWVWAVSRRRDLAGYLTLVFGGAAKAYDGNTPGKSAIDYALVFGGLIAFNFVRDVGVSPRLSLLHEYAHTSQQTMFHCDELRSFPTLRDTTYCQHPVSHPHVMSPADFSGTLHWKFFCACGHPFPGILLGITWSASAAGSIPRGIHAYSC